jgi:hypothetical protein
MHGSEIPAQCARRTRVALGCVLALVYANVHAFDIPTADPDIKVRWDTNLKYSTAHRLNDADPALIGPYQANLDDGNRNFRKAGIVSSRIDIFTEADLIFKERFGARISGAGWYDSMYNRGNSNDSPFTANSTSVANDQFTQATRDLMGSKAELLDAFIFGSTDIGDSTASFRLGKHSQIWGETLFFGSNGIAGAMAPIDYVKLFNVPGSQFKEVVLPVNQVSGQVQVRPGLTFSGYYQFEWKPNRIPAAGAFSSFSDIYGDGRERMLWATGSNFANAGEMKPSDGGQYGVQARIRPAALDADIGVYAVRYHQKDPNVYIRPSAGGAFFAPGNQGGPGQQVGDFVLTYQEATTAYGTSLSTTVGSANVGIEASVRDNAALVNPGMFVFDPTTNNTSNPAFPVGRTAHLNMSTVILLSPTPLWQGGVFLAELGWNRLLSVTKNPQAVDPNATRDAWGFRMILAPTYFQVMDGVDLSVPIGLGYNPQGRSSAVSLFNGGVDKGGDFSIGLSGTYHKNLTFGVTYTTYFGTTGAVLAPANDRLSYQQYYGDRSNISASVQMSF